MTSWCTAEGTRSGRCGRSCRRSALLATSLQTLAFASTMGFMARLRVGTQFADTAPKAAAAVSATARAGTLAVGQRAATLGDYLREQRRAAQLSLRQLAEQAGVSNPYLSQIERGLRRPSAEVLQQLAKALRISAEQLYIRAGILSLEEGVGGSVELAV